MPDGNHLILPDPVHRGATSPRGSPAPTTIGSATGVAWSPRNGFPAPLPGFARPLKRPSAQVENWIGAKRSAESLPPPRVVVSKGNVVVLEKRGVA